MRSATMATRTAPKKSLEIKSTRSAARIIQIIMPGKDKTFKIQTVNDEGKQSTHETTAEIYEAVTGKVHGDNMQLKDLGIRKLVGVKFRTHHNEDNLLVGLDIVPNRYFQRGAMPVKGGEALKEGFPVVWRDDINGFHVDHGYSGLNEGTLGEILDSLRKARATKTKTITVKGHKVTLDGEGQYIVRPNRPDKTFDDPRRR